MVDVPMAAEVAGSDSFATGDAAESVAFFPFGIARLGLRNRPPNLPVVDFLPSPSVISVSEVVSVFFSRRLPRLLKKERRFSGPEDGGEVVVGVPVVGAASVVFTAGEAVVGSVEETIVGSSI